jgi:hypothetical protein
MVDSSRLFRVFVSSSFVDMAQERRALMDGAFAPLTELCASRRASFQAVDLRWGIGPEAARDQQTMPICLAEVRRCLRLSPRLNILALPGDRRGWLPVPTSIPLGEYWLLAVGLTRAERRLLATGGSCRGTFGHESAGQQPCAKFRAPTRLEPGDTDLLRAAAETVRRVAAAVLADLDHRDHPRETAA